MSSRSKTNKTPLPNAQQNCKKCRRNDDYDNMVQCETEGCEKWFHYSCVGFTDEFKDNAWYCEQYSDQNDVANKSGEQAAHEQQIGSQKQSSMQIPSPPRVLLEVGSHQQPTAITSMQVQLQQAQGQLHESHAPPHKPNARRVHDQGNVSSQLHVPQIRIPKGNKNPSKAKSSKSKSASSEAQSYVSKSRASSKNGKFQLQLQRLEEETQLREQREKDYIQKKYELYDEHNSDSEYESYVEETEKERVEQQRVGQERVKNWVNDAIKKDDRVDNTWMGGIPSAAPKALHPQQQPLVNPKEVQQHEDKKTILNKHQIAARQIMSKEQVNFYGNPEEWPLFISWWENSTRSCGYTKQENLLRLQRCIKGDAMKKLKYKLVMPEQVDRAIETLRMLYGRPEIIIETLLDQIRSEPPLKSDKLESIIDFSLSVENICVTMQASGLQSHLNNSYLLKELIDKLPTQIKLSWGMHKQGLTAIDLQVFSNWLAQIALAASEVTTTTFVTKEHKSIRKSKAFVNVHQGREEKQDGSKQFRICCVCDGKCKAVNSCQSFMNMSLSDKWATLKRNFLCRTCLRQHGRRRCSSSDVCGINGCTFRHHRLLHDVNKQIGKEQPENKQPNESEKQISEEASKFSGTMHRKGQSSTLFKIIPVTLYYDGSQIDTYAFLDDGSSVTLVEEELAHVLNADSKNEPLCLKWTANTRRMEEASKKINFEVSATGAQQRFSLPDVHTVKSLELPKQSINARRLLTEYRHLRVVPLKSYENAKPRLLIGLQHCNLGVPIKTIEGNVNEPVAMKTRLGWTVFGTDPSYTNISTFSTEASFNFHLCECQNTIDDDMHRMMKEYFAIESLVGKKRIKLLSNDDAKAVQLLEQKTTFDGRRYTVPLLWKHDSSMLPSSRKMAERRLNCLEKKFSKEPELFYRLDNQIKEYVEKGYSRKLNPSEIDKHPAWYLPIFPVFNPNKPNKVRIVWDAAAKVNGVSLNSFLLTGPDEVPSLTGVLYRFREGKYAIFGDICEMFHQIKVLEEDQQFLRFLWRNTVTNEIEVFIMLVLIFGSTSSPFCAQFIKNKNAHRFADKLPRAHKAITENHFVDDFLDSVDDEDKAILLAKDVIFVHQQGGFEIRNFMSNSENIIKALDDKAINTSKFHQDLSFADSAEKLLGMWWSPTGDNFLFTFKTKKVNQEVMSGKTTPTKRQVLSALMCVFDPLGLIANFIIILKILLQDIWRSAIGWDDDIKEVHFERWKTWLSIIPDIKNITISRHYLTNIKKSKVQLHVFVDASETAYAAVAYFRVPCALSAKCALISARTRVGPIKPISIPRMELEAAVLGTRLAKSIIEEHSFDINDVFFWTDSKIVLCWIKSDQRKYNLVMRLKKTTK